MDTIAARLKAARLEKVWSQADLAKRSGVSQGTIGNIESGARQALGSLPKIADALHIRHNWLRDGDLPKYDTTPNTNNVSAVPASKQVPLISWVRAGGWGEIDDHQPDTDETVDAYHSNPSQHAFALTVEGDSMTSATGLSFPSGCKIIVEPNRSPKVGDYVIAKDVVTQQATFKRLASDGGRWYLRPLNKDYPTLEIDCPEQRVIGVVIEWRIGGKL